MLKKIVGLTESQHIAHRSPYAINIPLGKMIVEKHVKVLIDRQLPRHPFHFRHPVFQQLLAFLELNDAVLNRNGLRYGDGGQVGYVSSDGGNEQNGNIGDEKAAKNLRLLKNRYPPYVIAFSKNNDSSSPASYKFDHNGCLRRKGRYFCVWQGTFFHTRPACG